MSGFAGLMFKAYEAYQKMTGARMDTGVSTAQPGKIYSFEMNTIDGTPKSLGEYRGLVLMIVNTASLCGFTPQYDGLEELYQRYKDAGLRILAFPANNFGAQEPGPDAQIREFCRTRYSVSFDLFSKISVKGPDMHPFYRFLTQESGYNGDIPWNFSKFLAAKDGRVAARFGPDAEPTSKAVSSKIKELLAQ